jgi:1-acyl-sn-glycerol-3-phosphate acyltransferase
MREWNRGFVRLAMALEAPIVPVAVFGGEECFPVAWTVKLLEPLIGSVVGLPLAPVPLPARWKVVFHEPVKSLLLCKSDAR